MVLADTDVLVGVKAELGEPEAAAPSSGRVHVSVEWYLPFISLCLRLLLIDSVTSCPSASPEFEGRGADELNVELARFTERYLKAPGALNLHGLTLIPGRQCWVLYVDIMVLESGGNLFDSISVAVRAALATTKIPKVTVIEKPGGQFELELAEDPEDLLTVDISGVPICVTFCKVCFILTGSAHSRSSLALFQCRLAPSRLLMQHWRRSCAKIVVQHLQ